MASEAPAGFRVTPGFGLGSPRCWRLLIGAGVPCSSFLLPLPLSTLPPLVLGAQSIMERFNPALENLVYLGNNYLRAFHGKCPPQTPTPNSAPPHGHHVPHPSSPYPTQTATHHFPATPCTLVLLTEGCEPLSGGRARGTPQTKCHPTPPCLLGLHSQSLLPPQW